MPIFQADCLEKLPTLGAGSVDCVIADPPYFKVVGQQWDYKWRVEADYLVWCESWLKECARVLRLGGSLFLFGYFRTLALLVSRFPGLGFELRQQIIVNKGLKAVAGRHTKLYKQFPCVTESVLFLFRDNKPWLRSFLRERRQAVGLTAKQINEAMGVRSNGGGMWSIWTGDNICEQFPTREQWSKLQTLLQFDTPYDKVALSFTPTLGLTDVWDDIDFYEEDRKHPTQKPTKLIERLVLAVTSPGSLVLDPFMGSGTTGIVCAAAGRQFVGIEQDPSYFAQAQARLGLQTPGMPRIAALARAALAREAKVWADKS